MKYTLQILVFLMILSSCKNSTQKKQEVVKEKQIVTEQQDNKKKPEENKDNEKQVQQTDCDKYWKNRFPSDSTKAKYIDEVISENELTKNNLEFLNALKNEKHENLAFKNALSPIFRLSNTEIGLFSFTKYKNIDNKTVPISKELDLIEKFSVIREYTMDHYGKIKFYPMILDSIFKEKPKPTINYYTTKQIDSTKILELGIYVDECLEYFEYSIDTTNISKNDKLLFSSPFLIDLVFENSPKVDSLLQNDYKKECLDCPNSTKLQKSFSRVKGTNNLYFVFADTFPINNKLDTPSRALILINKKNEIIYLWYDEVDLFGCSCL